MQSQSNSLDVDLLSRLQEPEEFEEFALIFRFDANSVINDRDLKEAIFSFVL